ncbi:MAG: DMT family transporter [Parasporobacterium sp.]|nr:DMT family transporter [Parasporobacterium sp.]
MIVQKIKFVLSVVLFGTLTVILYYLNMPPVVTVFFRGSLGFLTVIVVMLAMGKRPEFKAIKSNLLWLLISGVALGINWVFLFSAYNYVGVAVATLINYMAPMIAIFLSAFIYKEKITFAKLICIAVTFIGVIFASGIFGKKVDFFDPIGILIAGIATLSFVVIIFCNKKFKDISFYDKTTFQLGTSAVVVLPFAINSFGNMENAFDLKAIILIAIVGIVQTGIAYCFYFDGIGKLPIQTSSILGYIEPALAVILSMTILKQPISAIGIFGAILVIGGAIASEIVGRKQFVVKTD